jgi:hypothetical protein
MIYDKIAPKLAELAARKETINNTLLKTSRIILYHFLVNLGLLVL